MLTVEYECRRSDWHGLSEREVLEKAVRPLLESPEETGEERVGQGMDAVGGGGLLAHKDEAVELAQAMSSTKCLSPRMGHLVLTA